MSELPHGWTNFRITDIGGLSGGKTPSKADSSFWDSADIPWVSPKDMKKLHIGDSEDRISEKSLTDAGMTLYPKDSILMVTRSGILQHTFPVAITTSPVTVNQDIKVIRPLDGVQPAYLLHLLRACGQKILEKCSKDGTTVQSIATEKLEQLELPLAPLTEQVRIAQALDGLLAQVDTLKARLDALPALIKRFRQSVLSAAITRQLTTIGLEEPRTSDTGNETEVTQFREVRLGDVATDFSYGTTAKSQKAGSVPVLRMGNIQNGKLDWHELVYTSDCSEIEKYKLSSGDILFNRTNSPELVGKTAIYKDARPAIYAGYLIRVRCGEKLLPDYLNHCLNSPQGRDYCWQVKTDGVSQSNINAKKLADFRFDLPSIEVQAEIVRRVEQLFAFADQLEARLADARARVDALTQSILAKAFRGELVPQDPADEPASVLLERIKAQRAAAPKPKRGRKSV